MAKVASVQMDVAFGDPEANTKAVISHLERLSAEGVELAVFPECVLTGYCVATRDAAKQIAITRYSTYLIRINKACQKHNIIAVLGFAESGNRSLRNTAVILEPGKEPRFYEKTHLPELGYDKFVKAGGELPVFETRIGRVGILICFDCRAPEAARTLALQGADIIALPTNWPKGALVSANVLAVARAVENKVYVVTANRVGTENGFEFFGLSKIIDPVGNIIEEAGAEATVLIADVDFEKSRVKRIVVKPGEHETTVFESRRPELYGEIVRQSVSGGV